jgi:hypothetical protein
VCGGFLFSTRREKVDPVTHALAGLVVGQLFQADGVGLAVATTGALAPDVEFLTRRIPRTAFLDYHHGLVHTLPGGLVAGFLIAVAAGTVTGRDWISLLPLALAGIASHIVLDLLMHNNGIALLAPCSRRRFSIPLVWGLNPISTSPRCRERTYGTCLVCQANGMRYNPFFWVLLAALAARLAVPTYARAWGAIAVIMLLGIALYSNRMRIRALAASGKDKHSLRRRAFPASFDLSLWLVLLEGHLDFRAVLADSRNTRLLWEKTIPKRPPPPPVMASERLLSVRGFRNSVMFPHWDHRRLNGVDHVTWSDLSYLFSQDVDLYELHVQMAGDGSVLQNEFNERW